MRDLSLHLMDIVQNSLKAGSDRIIVKLEAYHDTNCLIMTVEDNGHGMPPEMVETVVDPFVTTRTTRSIGLGIPLLKEHCDLTGGNLRLESEVGHGTRLEAVFGLDSIDRMPLGDISDTMTSLVLSDPAINYLLIFESDRGKFALDWRDLRDQLKDVALSEPAVLEWIKDSIEEQQQYIFGGVLHEIIS